MPAGKGIGGHTLPNEGSSDDWITPKFILDALGTFDLDPCASMTQPWKTAEAHWTKEDNGLSREWHGKVWLNPPYGRQTETWLNRLANHGDGVALVFARTETSMFFAEVWNKASALLFLEGRLYFHLPNGERAPHNSGGPSVLISYGDRCAALLKSCSLKGAYVEPIKR